MILVIDNYDSFTYNLVQYIGSMGKELIIKRNDCISIREIEELEPDKIVISPGPGYPVNAGISLSTIKHFHTKCPILGVCLGHQVIAEAFKGRIIQAKELVHGKYSTIHHDGKYLFKGVQNPLLAGRYHSLVVERESLPGCLEITAKTDDEQIMGIRHKDYRVEGVQFHPESILTNEGVKIIENFINM
ncbi:aminodeoxychorismate/anthranilate synthase component II [candidate division KSB1 bacterium]|nr:aminodeoxychorismate/anthranilate synthase component II [candidate division KSB1 bacterium]